MWLLIVLTTTISQSYA